MVFNSLHDRNSLFKVLFALGFFYCGFLLNAQNDQRFEIIPPVQIIENSHFFSKVLSDEGEEVELSFINPSIELYPRFSFERGFYDQAILLTISSGTGRHIVYTTDGSIPSRNNGVLYANPITINKTTVVRTIAYGLDGRNSKVTTHSYIFLRMY